VSRARACVYQKVLEITRKGEGAHAFFYENPDVLRKKGRRRVFGNESLSA
jgi:hypothetical protein